jgi:succinyl-diaminopimelate desuccinylase
MTFLKNKENNIKIKKDLLLLIEKLVSFKTIKGNPEEMKKCAVFIQEYISDLGLNADIIERNKVYSVIFLPKKNYAPVLLMSHLDVVNAPDSLFKMKIKNNNLYGRGVLDDKYAIAISLLLLKKYVSYFKNNNFNIKDLPLGLLITGDEEVGGKNGAEYILKKINSEFAIALDGGDTKNIIMKSKGFLKIKLVSKGKTAHGSRPWMGINAIDILIEDIIKIKKLFVKKTKDNWNKTLNVGVISGGNCHNQVPDYAESFLDIRYTENDDYNKIILDIKKIIKSNISVEIFGPMFYSSESPYFSLFESVAYNTKRSYAHGASDARFLSSSGINGIVWGADGDSSFHQEDEHVSINSIIEVYNILDAYLRKIIED